MARADEAPSQTLQSRLAATRKLTLDLAAPLSDADATIQPHPDASPAKWHLAHTTWFFETFVLRDQVRGYRLHDERWPFLFNSYYNGEGERHARPRRGMISRPSLDEVRDYRLAVDEALQEAFPNLNEEALALVALGINHEQQHQELFLTDLLATLAENPLEPAYQEAPVTLQAPYAAEWISGAEGVVEIGAQADGFAFDCERPRHRTYLYPYEIAGGLVANGDWQGFIDDGGYRTPTLWLSEGWDWVQAEAIDRPLYWHEDGTQFTLAGRREIDPHAPAAHVSYYEAEAFARWAGARLPTEAEWEHAFAGFDARAGDQLDASTLERGAVMPQSGAGPFGACWQWTRSAYLPYPGFAEAEGTVGEYNGKFMCGQFVLKGASCATPRGHSRASYRNFFPPAARWQFTGVRLARDT